MRNRFFACMGVPALLIAAVSLTQVTANGQARTATAKPAPPSSTKTWTPPRTADGHPDLQGTWNYSTLTPLERPRDLAGKESFTEKEAAEYEKSLLEKNNRDNREGGADADLARAYNDLWYDSGAHVVKTRRTSLIIDPPDGRIPALTPEAAKREAARAEDRRKRGPEPADTWEDRSLGERCLTRGAPKLPSAYNNHVQIVQSPGYVALLQEMIHEARIIPVDGRPHAAKNIRQWLGDSVGHWEGDTLVVDTTNYPDMFVMAPVNCCPGAGANLHVIERFKRVDADTIDYQYTVDDPSTYTKSWTVSVPMSKTDEPIYEYACHEGNYGMKNLLSGARAMEKAAAEAKKK